MSSVGDLLLGLVPSHRHAAGTRRRGGEVARGKPTHVEAHAVYQGGLWIITPALGCEVPYHAPAGVTMLLMGERQG